MKNDRIPRTGKTRRGTWRTLALLAALSLVAPAAAAPQTVTEERVAAALFGHVGRGAQCGL